MEGKTGARYKIGVGIPDCCACRIPPKSKFERGAARARIFESMTRDFVRVSTKKMGHVRIRF